MAAGAPGHPVFRPPGFPRPAAGQGRAGTGEGWAGTALGGAAPNVCCAGRVLR
jgi:hypothetical protein